MSQINTILGIETSCDETAAAVLQGGTILKSSIISSQIKLHQQYGGVVPELASRNHLEKINLIIEQALEQAKIDFSAIDAIAVTKGPGLVGSLLIGIVAAKTLAWLLNKPLIGVNHVLGHIYANLLEHGKLEPPLICLTVSGGHTDLLYLENWGQYEILGRTRDDAAGEAFDKVARFLGLGYPGGPEIQRISAEGASDAFKLPKAVIKDHQYDFSFSGLKTAVINVAHQYRQRKQEFAIADLAASFQKTVVEILVEKTMLAAQSKKVDKVLLSGGVACNTLLRQEMQAKLAAKGIELYYPSLPYCTDNAAMIACAGYYLLKAGYVSDLSLDAEPGLKL